jgi:hypothetical protein
MRTGNLQQQGLVGPGSVTPLDLAELLVSCWRVGAGQDRIPTSHWILDRALKDLVDNGSFPEWARTSLHFVDSRIGLQCIELQGILEWAQGAQLTTAPNPSYRFAEITISKEAAAIFLRRLGIAKTDAEKWGAQLHQGVEKARASMASNATL